MFSLCVCLDPTHWAILNTSCHHKLRHQPTFPMAVNFCIYIYRSTLFFNFHTSSRKKKMTLNQTSILLLTLFCKFYLYTFKEGTHSTYALLFVFLIVGRVTVNEEDNRAILVFQFILFCFALTICRYFNYFFHGTVSRKTTTVWFLLFVSEPTC